MEDDSYTVPDKLRTFLSAHGLSAAESNVLMAFDFPPPLPPAQLIGTASSESTGSDLPSSSEHECKTALDSLIAKGLVQVVDDDTIRDIANDLSRRDIMGPIDGLPPPGWVDVTRQGGILLLQLLSEVFDWNEDDLSCRRIDRQPNLVDLVAPRAEYAIDFRFIRILRR